MAGSASGSSTWPGKGPQKESLGKDHRKKGRGGASDAVTRCAGEKSTSGARCSEGVSSDVKSSGTGFPHRLRSHSLQCHVAQAGFEFRDPLLSNARIIVMCHHP